MTSLVEQVRASVPPACIANGCRKRGCTVSLTGAPRPFVMIDMDCDELQINRASRRCDFMFVSDKGRWVVPLELKRGRLNAGEIVAQLRAGRDSLTELSPKEQPFSSVP